MQSSTRPPMIVELTEEIAKYMTTKFRSMLSNPMADVPYPDHWDMDFLIDCDLAVHVLVKAYHNRGNEADTILEAWRAKILNKERTSWDIEDYGAQIGARNDGRNVQMEGGLYEAFPPIHNPFATFHEPLLVTDTQDHGLVWYLPGILSPARQKSMWERMNILQTVLKVQTGGNSWRSGPKHYRSAGNDGLRPGTVSLAPAWFEQGHDTDGHPLKVSAALVPAGGAGALWVEAMMEDSALLGGILSIVQPKQYASAIEVSKRLNATPQEVDRPDRLLEILHIWTAPFHGISIISNRVTPPHRDPKGRKEWLDLLVAVGNYNEGWFFLPGLGLRLRYLPATVVLVAGRLITHAADCTGDRACIAYYMREKVHERLGMDTVEWYKIE